MSERRPGRVPGDDPMRRRAPARADRGTRWALDPVPELTRHLRPRDEIYRPDPAAALPPPRHRRPEPQRHGGRAGGDRADPAPPRGRAHRASGRRGWRFKLGGVVLVSAALVVIGAGQLPTGNVPPTSTPTALAQVIPVRFDTPTPTSMPPTPAPTPSPSPTATPDPRYVGKVVCLDPGHGGSDRGYTREANDVAPAMEEAVYNLAFARAVKARLEARGFTVVMTRHTDSDVNADGRDVNGDGLTRDNAPTPEEAQRAGAIDELQARINICNEARADLLVSMHINGFPDPSVKGYETWYSSARPFKELNLLFATLAFEELGQQMAAAGYNATPRRVNDDAHAHVDTGRHVFDRYVITGPEQPGQIVPSAMPGAIVEVLFISNDEDAAFLASNEGRNAIVTAYERAIIRYFDELAERR